MTRISTRWLALPAAALGVSAMLFADPSDDRRSDSEIERSAAAADPEQRIRDRDTTKAREIYALRFDFKVKLLQQLIAGQTTLNAVAAEFLRLNRDTSSTLLALRLEYPDVADDEAAALNVLDGVIRLTEPGDRRNAVLARLGAEFHQHYGHEWKRVR